MQQQYDGPFSERVPPQNLEAEQSVLGACLIDKEAWNICKSILKSDDFYSDKHQLLWQAMQQAAKGGAVDPITVMDQLNTMAQPNGTGGTVTAAEQIGGMTYLMSLGNLVPTTANVERYAEIVVDKAKLRRIRTEALKVLDACYTAEDPDEVLGDWQNGMNRALSGGTKTSLKPIGGRIGSYAEERFQKRHLPNDDWIPSRFPDLREKCPFLRREVTLLAMPPNNGKTTILMNEAEFLAELGYEVAVFELEQADAQVFDKLIAKRARISSKKIRMGLLDEFEWIRYRDTARDMDRLTNLHLNTETEETMMSIRRQCLRLKNQRGRLDFVLIDFLDRIQEKAEKNERYDQVIARIVGMGQAIARECNCHVYFLGQADVKILERPNPIPSMGDLANSKTNLSSWPDNIITGIQPGKAESGGGGQNGKQAVPSIWGVECRDARWKDTLVLNIAKARHSEGGGMIPIYADLATGFLGPLRRPWPWQKACEEGHKAEYDDSGDADHYRAMKAFKAKAEAVQPVDSF